MKNTRKPTGWIGLQPGSKQRVILKTTCSIDDEIFASLHYISEVQDVGLKYIKSFGHSNAKHVWLRFRSFIRQAKAFHDAALQLHYRASALLYYYCFLNLIKAYICLTNPNSVSDRIGHGLIHKFTPGKLLSSQFIAVSKNIEVFQLFYQKLIGKTVPKNTKLNISLLLAYCSDIGYEYENAGYGNHKRLPVLIRILSNNTNKTSWARLAVRNYDQLSSYKKSLKKFNSYFKIMDADSELEREIFKIYAHSLPNFTFFESKDDHAFVGNKGIPAPDIRKKYLNAVGTLFESNMFDDGIDFFLSIPYQKSRQLPCNEFLSIYIIMYYLGSLVRYQPWFLEQLIQSRDAWMIDRFTKSSTTTFLRYAASHILGKELVFVSR